MVMMVRVTIGKGNTHLHEISSPLKDYQTCLWLQSSILMDILSRGGSTKLWLVLRGGSIKLWLVLRGGAKKIWVVVRGGSKKIWLVLRGGATFFWLVSRGGAKIFWGVDFRIHPPYYQVLIERSLIIWVCSEFKISSQPLCQFSVYNKQLQDTIEY